MLPATRRLLLPALLLGWLASAGPARAVFPPPVKDEGKFFSKEALEKADKKVRQIYQAAEKDVVVETFPAIPTDLEKKYKEEGKEKFFEGWARSRARGLGVNGIYVLICKSPGHVQVEVGNNTQKRAFTLKNRRELIQKLVGQFREKKFDDGLLEGLNFIESTMKSNLGAK